MDARLRWAGVHKKKTRKQAECATERCVDCQLTASCRVRRVYFAERFHEQKELPAEWNWKSSSMALPLSTPRHGNANDHETKRSLFDSCPPISLSSAR